MEIFNREARFHYEVLETCEAGLALTGSEVKAVKRGHARLKGSYVSVRNNELWLMNTHISPYQPKNHHVSYEPNRPRKLLLKRSEIDRLRGKLQTQGLTIVPLKVYTKKALLKVEIAVVRGKKQFDKRASIKEREVKKRIRSALRRSVR